MWELLPQAFMEDRLPRPIASVTCPAGGGDDDDDGDDDDGDGGGGGDDDDVDDR